jgi:TRAP-type C4-dicarboxylate transport system substrate-binding protein
MTFMKTSFAALAAMAMLAAPAMAQQTMRLNHNNPAEHPTGRSLEFLAERVGGLTDGAIRIRAFHSAQLGSQRDSTEMVPQGALEMARSNTPAMEAFEPLYAVINTPFLFESQDHNFDVLTGDIGREILEASADKGFVGLGGSTTRAPPGMRATSIPRTCRGASGCSCASGLRPMTARCS